MYVVTDVGKCVEWRESPYGKHNAQARLPWPAAESARAILRSESRGDKQRRTGRVDVCGMTLAVASDHRRTQPEMDRKFANVECG